MKNNKNSRIPVKAAALIFWLAVWQGAAYLVHNKILLAGPAEVGIRLKEELMTVSFYQSVSGSLLRIMAGFFSGFFAGLLFGVLSGRSRFLKVLLDPVISAMKSVPVAAFVVLVLIWAGSKNLAVPISFLVVFPHVYISTLTGLSRTDPELLEMADAYDLHPVNRILYIYRPALAPFLSSAAKVTIGMSFKSGIAAEVIGIPEYSIGSRLYLSKIYLDTSGVLAWTVTILVISSLCERGILCLLKAAERWKPAPVRGRRRIQIREFSFDSMEKRYESGVTVKTPACLLPAGSRIGVMGSSGCGKTTWFRMLLSLEGQVCASCVFQEDRLCPELSAVENVRMVCREEALDSIRRELLYLLPEDALDRPVSELSGGMKRRTAVARACLSGGNLLLFDEPFTGLDRENRERTGEFILNHAMGRTILFTTHQPEDFELLCAEKYEFGEPIAKPPEKR